jgi:phenylacetate-CoA ligase
VKLREVARRLPNPIRQGIKYTYGSLPPRLRYGKVFWETYNFLQESQCWSQEKIEEYQIEQLGKLLRHAYENVPYYRKVFDERRLKPKDIKSLEDLRRNFPLLTKETIKKCKDEFISKTHGKHQLKSVHTGGTTGSPLHFFYEEGVSIPKEKAFFWRMWNWHGYRWGDRCLAITGAYEVGDRVQYSPVERCVYLYNPIIDAQHVRDYVDLIKRFRPKVIRAYPSLIFLLARFINQNGLKLKDSSIETVFCASEKILDFQREEIGEAINCKVVDHYGHNEMQVLMQRCEENCEYHVISEYGITEIIGKDGRPVTGYEGEGEIVGTGFNNYAFPMIRYKTEDWAVVSERKCKCGREHPLVKDIIGRSGDFILTPSGKLVSPTTIEFAIDYIKSFNDIQIVQIDIDMIEIQIVPDSSYSEDEGRRFVEGVKARIGEKMHVRIALMDGIERSPSQKRRFIKSEISKQFLGISNCDKIKSS